MMDEFLGLDSVAMATRSNEEESSIMRSITPVVTSKKKRLSNLKDAKKNYPQFPSKRICFTIQDVTFDAQGNCFLNWVAIPSQHKVIAF